MDYIRNLQEDLICVVLKIGINMKISIRKALAIACWDVYVNDVFYKRFDRKYQAEQYAREVVLTLVK